mmetsp:Transcript_126564/g.253025  ORF Transcript_126564/g.253025 Transcript_126564/m.253025 type:complete len:633 (+) Transcript_126564:68-1966(+)|eukprot:CAMPEP_0172714952 /NCGR_PEP_ID=MMETSP1074-20121228/67267_1 /TAXON_ID=2916 /ORGANISM="Ceratium fusus, Strain PA161109" /LENGTH=632 /DNA_ID=CAMNT_0013539481 /DNA_START=62 /DNA_END=1960 /DNA_ORIENTATION=-
MKLPLIATIVLCAAQALGARSRTAQSARAVGNALVALQSAAAVSDPFDDLQQSSGSAAASASAYLEDAVAALLHGASGAQRFGSAGNATNAATPLGASMKNIQNLTQNLMKTVLKKHNIQQQSLDQHCGLLENCLQNMRKSRDRAREKLRRFRRQNKLHQTCRGEEDALASDQARCLQLKATQAQTSRATCNALKEFKASQGEAAAHKAAGERNDGEDVKAYLKRLAGRYCGTSGGNAGLIQKLVGLKQACRNASAELQSTATRCNAHNSVRLATRQRCGALQDSMGKASCESATIQRQACSTYHTCSGQAINSYSLTKSAALEQEAGRKNEWKRHLRMQCMVKFLMSSSNKTELKKCEERASKANVNHLDLKYTCNTAPMPCGVTSPYPGSPSYDKMLSRLPKGAPAKKSQACENIDTFKGARSRLTRQISGGKKKVRKRKKLDRAQRKARRCARKRIRIQKTTGTCTCHMSVKDKIEYVYVDGKDVTAKVSGDLSNWGIKHTISFPCGPSTLLAVQGTGSDAGCAGGGMAVKCTSTDKASPWNELVADTTWKVFGATCKDPPCTKTPKNVVVGAPANWYAPGFDDSMWDFAVKGSTDHAQGPVGTPWDICSPSGPAWLFRSFIPCGKGKK